MSDHNTHVTACKSNMYDLELEHNLSEDPLGDHSDPIFDQNCRCSDSGEARWDR